MYFQEDLPGLPPDREIKFAIELAPRTAQVSKAPYRLAPVEMKKLVAQLIGDLFDRLHGAVKFSKIDLRTGYHQLNIKPEDVPKTAFRTSDIDNILVHLKDRGRTCITFEDSVRSTEERKVICQFLKVRVLAKGSTVLGHVVNSEEVLVDPAKIKAVSNWERPTTPTEVRNFVDLAGYYRRCVQDFAIIAAPLTRLTLKTEELNGLRNLKLIKDYDCEILYHPGKANVVANALSRKKRPKMITSSDKLIQGFEKMEIEVKITRNGIERLVEIAMQPKLLQEIKLCQERMTSEGIKSMLEKALKTEKE
ncbi:hypothetical protein POM88_006866 [Heracleum sosnowskyi]|uniref:Reverse transcriptase domain-containing protein n=1 Tax=Heracleum sosnowskyi TaxID=360622 RepID=A0AAD8J5N0_9APIA|nr:hypothetical protein POM88_006866 [Heracleum sosnowskyi]